MIWIYAASIIIYWLIGTGAVYLIWHNDMHEANILKILFTILFWPLFAAIFIITAPITIIQLIAEGRVAKK